MKKPPLVVHGQPRAWRRAALLSCFALAAGALTGCATYTDIIVEASRATSSGSYENAVAELNRVLEVSSAEELPEPLRGNQSLAMLERGVLQQALGQFEHSKRDFSAAEQELELLDLKTDPIGVLGSYLYSDSVKTYKTPPTERLTLNALNLLNYLALGDLDGAAVEARRFQVMRDYLASEEIDAASPAALGAYLAGFVFEQRGEGDRALRYYDEALANGPLASLTAPIVDLAQTNPYRTERLSEILERAASAAPDDPTQAKPAPKPKGELLIILNLGRVPHRVPERMPIGAAIGFAGAYVTRDLDVLKYSATKVIVYPQLVDTPSQLAQARVRVDGRSVEVEQLTHLGAAVRAEYEQAKPKIIAAALTRVAARAAVAEGIRAGGDKKSSALGDVLSLLFELVLVGLDRPDTRSWTMPPERVLVARVPVAPGTHSVEVNFGSSAARSVSVEIPASGFAAVVVTEPR
jgi:hypothetical protein